MNINAIHRTAAKATAITSGAIVYQCGHQENFHASSAYGFAFVAGMAASTDCPNCAEVKQQWMLKHGYICPQCGEPTPMQRCERCHPSDS